MTRAFLPDPVAPEALDRILDAARRAPSAGYTQGVDLIVLRGPEQTRRFWEVSLPEGKRREEFGWPGLLQAPVLVIPVCEPDAYVRRYGEPDKASTGLGAGRDRWPVAYWTVDASFAAMAMQYAAIDEMLGVLFFGIPNGWDEVLGALGVPAGYEAIGALAIGHVDGAAPAPSGSPTRRGPARADVGDSPRWLVIDDDPAMPGTDRSYLQTEAYADSTKLRTRASIYQYRTPPGTMGEWVLARTDWPAGCRVLDVGCGPGSYLALLSDTRAVGVDLSPGMAAEASTHAPAAVGDAARLPFADVTFDRVLAPHMLYHCPDIPAAVAELRRVLRPGGVMIAVTNDPKHLAELRAIHRTTGADPLLMVERFSLANGADLLAASFTEVRLERFDGALAIPDVRPVADYVESMIGWHGDRAPEDVRAEIERLVGQIIERDGVFRATTKVGAFICR